MPSPCRSVLFAGCVQPSAVTVAEPTFAVSSRSKSTSVELLPVTAVAVPTLKSSVSPFERLKTTLFAPVPPFSTIEDMPAWPSIDSAAGPETKQAPKC